MKKKLYIATVILVAILIVVYKWCSLPIFLMLQGYVPNNYTVYKEINDIYKRQVIKVYNKNEDFKYIEVNKNQFGLWEIDGEGELCTQEDFYTSFAYKELIIEVEDESFSTDVQWHKVFEMKHEVKGMHFNFENLPKEVSYEFMEMGDSYIVELISCKVPVRKIGLEVFVDGI